MNCSRCGKEIPDGENKICEDCQKSLLNEMNSESEENKFKMKKEDEKKKSSKKEKNNDGKSKKKKIVIAIIVLVIIAVLVALEFTTNIISNLFLRKNTVGNTIGNIRNYGYAAYEKQWIYYISPNSDSTKICLNKVKNDGTKKQVILEADYDMLSINAIDGYLYFITIDTTEADTLASTLPEDEKANIDYVNNKICRMKNDGTELTVINDNEFSNDCYEIYVIKDKVYYIGEDYNIYTMNLDGSNKTQISKNKTGYLGISEKYILYNDYPEGSENLTEEEAENTDYVTYVMNIDGTNARPVNGKRLYSVTLKDDYIYYTNDEKQICKVKVDGTEDSLVFDTDAYNMNLSGNYVYYMNYKDEEASDYTVCIYRVKTDGTENKVIKELNTYSSFIDVLGSQVFYMDSSNDQGHIALVNGKDSKEIELYTIDYGNISSTDTSTNATNETAENTSSEETNSETNTVTE